MKKYEFTGEKKQVFNSDRTITLHRIRAVNAFGKVVAGMLGGWIEKEENLSHNGNAWVFDNSCVYDSAEICNNAEIHDFAIVNENAAINGDVYVGCLAHICGNAYVDDCTLITGSSCIHGNARICGNTRIRDNVCICGNTRINGDVLIRGNAYICSNACISSTDHVLVIGLIGSRNDFTTFFRDADNEITVTCGCFLGKIDEFLKKVIGTHGATKHAQVYRAAAELAKLQIDLRGTDEIN